MFKSYPLFGRFVVFVAVPLFAAAAVGAWYLRGSLPEPGVSQRTAAVSSPVELARDAFGTVFIAARTDRDAFFALGYAHAQDRLWQLELQRRLAQGRLSEVFGRATLQQDVWMRTLGLYRAAESSWDRLDAPSRESLTAYAAGINARLAEKTVLPPEFLALDVVPEPWREVDSLAWAKVFALNLAGNMKNEIGNLVASQYLAPPQLADLGLVPPEPALANFSPAVTKGLSDLAQLQAQAESRFRVGGRYVGSNAWAVSGSHTADGRPLLANDAHLGLQIPSLWYVARLKGDKLDVAGMTLVGLPVVIFGRNHDIAWGGTNMMADAQDLFVEQLNPDDANQYADGQGWRPLVVRAETIAIRAEFPWQLRASVDPVRLRVRETRHGPIVSDVLGALEQPVALRWTALDADDLSYQSFLRMNYAHDWASFRQALEGYVAPALNLLYVDSSNTIASISAGRFPVRAKGQGRLPVPGWNDDYAWSSYVPFEQWPQRLNPSEGFIVSANDNPVGADYPYFLSADWAPPERAKRIAELLRKPQGAAKLAFEDMQRMQSDTVDLGVSGLLAYLRELPSTDAESRRALDYLKAWNGDMAQDSSAAAIFHVWTRHLREALFARSLDGQWNTAQQRELDSVIAHTSNDQVLAALTTRASAWCDAPASTQPCAAVLNDTLRAALGELKKLRGTDPARWQWGKLHELVYASVPFSDGPLAPLFERRLPNGGSPDSINAASAVYRESEGYEQNFGAGFRQVMQPGSGDARHAYMNSTGQSGHPLSAHYDDMVRPFRDAQLLPLQARPASPVSVVTLTPGQG